jgi:1-phosphatidylinositol-4-phosphate 5-kinase
VSAEDEDLDTPLSYTFNDFHPTIFAKLRELRGITKEFYLHSLSLRAFIGNLSDHFSEGKSGSFFCFSPDGNFIIKTAEQEEADALQSILPAYYKVISHCQIYINYHSI